MHTSRVQKKEIYSTVTTRSRNVKKQWPREGDWTGNGFSGMIHKNKESRGEKKHKTTRVPSYAPKKKGGGAQYGFGKKTHFNV